ncbi:hypothetical protein ISN45_At01g057040 [Arabidopsis thaliana x Arabidopsis arenosa]|uniref:Uncharacterized protein n=2 Tax=Arabidopsis TaxID=3701 RepID=A0A8T2HGI2_ARASU|nr:hypothetical protein ISN45_At01g057040 [Arabidopsis thaliana x Arabidopsis arenosa]KAG7658623.1 hypothetical protein ISN44_As01g055900 [Arabidopsis suecica]
MKNGLQKVDNREYSKSADVPDLGDEENFTLWSCKKH